MNIISIVDKLDRDRDAARNKNPAPEKVTPTSSKSFAEHMTANKEMPAGVCAGCGQPPEKVGKLYSWLEVRSLRKGKLSQFYPHKYLQMCRGCLGPILQTGTEIINRYSL